MSEPTALREDLLKSAVSFLSSPNVQSADKAKKIAFLQKKGLTQAEIDEAFNRVGDDSTITEANASASSTLPAVSSTSPSPVSSTPSPAVSSVPMNNNLPPIVPSRHTQPQVIYYPQPPSPPVPTARVLALAIILGVGAVGAAATIIGILKRFIGRIFNRIANYQRSRYNQHRERNERLLKSLKSYSDENDDLDAVIDQGEEKSTIDALIKHQGELKDKLDTLIKQARVQESNAYRDFKSDLASFRSTVVGAPTDVYSSYAYNSYVRTNTDSPAVSGLKSDIRSLKAVMLNRRNFPTV